MLVIDRFDTRKRGQRGGRRITLFDRSKKVIRQWTTARSFYHAWLDAIFDEKPTYLISDSSFTGALIHDYRRDNVVLCQVMHNPFLQDPRGSIYGELSSGKFELLCNLDSFDLATTLTDQPRIDMNDAGLSTGRLRTVSNFTDDLLGDPASTRDRHYGVIVARLAEQKRVDDAVRAIGKARSIDSHLQLDVFGEGSSRPSLEKLIDDLGLAEPVRLWGHTTGAKRYFHSASFSLLTSRFERQGLVILESMSAGCIPIAYDIAYGPSDIIEDGVSGFLIPDGDIDACAEVIRRVMTLSDAEIEKMRRAAIARAADFFERPIVQQWGEVLAEQNFDPIVRLDNGQACVSSATVGSDSINMEISVHGICDKPADRVYVSWKSRRGSYFGRVPARVSNHVVRATIPMSRFDNISPGLIDISLDAVNGRNFNRVRIASDDSNMKNVAQAFTLYTTAHGNLSARIHPMAQADDKDRG